MSHAVARRDALVWVGVSIIQLQLQPPSWRLKRRKIRRWIHTALLISLRVEVGRETMGSVCPISCRLLHEDCVSSHLPPPTPFSSFHLRLFLSNPPFIRSTILSRQPCSSGGIECKQICAGFKVHEWSMTFYEEMLTRVLNNDEVLFDDRVFHLSKR